MQNVISTAKVPGLVISRHHQALSLDTNIFTRFINWCASQQENRFVWLALTLFGQIGLALPATLFSILYFGGNNFGLWILACVVNVPSLALNLAAQPTKVTLPVLFFAWITDIVIILATIITFYVQA